VIHERAFEFESLRVRIRSTDAATLDWLTEFLGPAFPAAHAARVADHTLSVECNSSEHERSLGAVPAGVENIDCFTLDQRFSQCRSWLDAAGRRLIHDARTDCVFIQDERRRRSWTILSKEGAVRVRLGVLRVVRELATAHALRLGFAHLHAAAVETRGRVVAFGGPRMSGKSTLLLHALASGETRFVTGDRLMIDPAGGQAVARGMPTIVTLRADAVGAFPALASRLRESGYVWILTKAEIANGVRHQSTTPGVSPAQICDLTGTTMTGAAPLELLAFPRIASDDCNGGVRMLAREEAVAKIRSSMFLASVPERIPAAFDRDATPFVRDEAALGALAMSLADRVRCVEVSLARRAPIWKEIAAHLA
jgi:hypothetical protein